MKNLLLIVVLASILFSCMPLERYGGITVFVDPWYKNILDREISHEIYTRNLKRVAKLSEVTSMTLVVADLEYIDFSPLTRMEKLNSLRIEAYGDGKFTYFPDLSALVNVKKLAINSVPMVTSAMVRRKTHWFKSVSIYEKAFFEQDHPDIDWENLNKMTHLRRLYINCADNFSIADISSLNNLEYLNIGANYFDSVIDLEGIENFHSLKSLSLEKWHVKNLHLLGNIKTLEVLDLEIPFEEEDLGFLKDLLNLRELTIYKDWLRGWSKLTDAGEREFHTYLDISSLKNMTKLELLDLRGFIILNSPIVDTLPSMRSIFWFGCFLEPDENGNISDERFVPGFLKNLAAEIP
jgi:hypothetical protein